MLGGIKKYLCAVDGGGTGCRALIADADGSALARANGGPANYTTNPKQAAQNVMEAIQTAAQSLAQPCDLNTLITHVGIAGILTDQDARDMAVRLPFESCTVSDDRITSALGVLGQRDGAVLAIGTGSFVAARRGSDVTFWGGWGFAVGDQASGAWLGRAVLDCSLKAYEGLAEHSPLTHAMLTQFGDKGARIANFAAQASPTDFARLAPQVIAAAKEGDAVGCALMQRGVNYLQTVLHTAQITDTDVICLTGGVGPHYEGFLAPKYRAHVRPPDGQALDGALYMARQKLHEMEKQA